MNERQRKILVDRVTKTFSAQKEDLEATIPDEPEINKHVIAAVLNGTLKVKSTKEIHEAIHKHVLHLGEDDTFIEVDDEEDWRRSRRRMTISRREFSIKMNPFFIMEEPASYKEALEKFLKIKKEVDKKIAALTDQFNTVTLKIEVGSAKTLEPLVMQIDSLGSLDLISNTLILGTTTTEQKLLSDGESK